MAEVVGFDDLPANCPGCGAADAPHPPSMATDSGGPSKLMFVWAWMINSYLCMTCNGAYTQWLGRDYDPTEMSSIAGLTVQEAAKPSCVKNVERIKAGEEPEYPNVPKNPMSCFGGPHHP